MGKQARINAAKKNGRMPDRSECTDPENHEAHLQEMIGLQSELLEGQKRQIDALERLVGRWAKIAGDWESAAREITETARNALRQDPNDAQQATALRERIPDDHTT